MSNQVAELIFIPFPGLSHLVSTVEAAKLLLRRDDRLSATVLTMKLLQENFHSYLQNTSSSPDTPSTLHFLPLPNQEQPTSSFEYINSLKDSVREIVSSKSGVGGLVLGMFCTIFMEVASELNIPVYIFYTSGASPLGLVTHLVNQQDLDFEKYKNSDILLDVPYFSIPVPAKVIPPALLEKNPFTEFVIKGFQRIPKSNGILVNTFTDLEPFAIESLGLDQNMPKIYPVGPVLNLKADEEQAGEDIIKWLDEQPESSVAFLCFGSMGSLEKQQVGEIAVALENLGGRFLWSLRKPPEKGRALHFTSEYESFDEVLPEGFLDRTKGFGKVIGWAPQKAILNHPAVGGFVSHCGWNSSLESVWFGVPVATFPLSAEQQVNAFHLVRQMKMAVEIRIDYSVGSKEIVPTAEIESAIRRLMEEGEIRDKVKEMQKKSRSALEEGGSSYNALNLFIEDVLKNIPESTEA